MKPNALSFGAVGTLPLISAGKTIPGVGQVPDSSQAISHLMPILLPFPCGWQDRCPGMSHVRLTLHRARAWDPKWKSRF